MASDKPQFEILDLLYDDELDEQTRAAARRDVEQSEEAREELEAYESMLAKIREVDLDEDVPDSVHTSIMASARKHAAKNTSRQAQVTRRAPTTSAPTRPNLWTRLNSSGVSQLVLAAAVVLVGGFIFVKIGSDPSTEHKFSAAESAVESQVTFGGEAADKFAKGAPDPATDEPAEEALAEGSAASEPVDVALEQPLAKKADQADRADRDLGSKESKLGEIAQLDKKATANQPRSSQSRPSRARQEPARSVRRRTRKSASRKKAAPDDQMEVFQGSTGTSATTSKKRPAPVAAEKVAAEKQEKASLDELLGASSPSASGTSSSGNAGVSDGTDIGQKLGSLTDDSRADRPSADSAYGYDDSSPSVASSVASSGAKDVEAESKPVATRNDSAQEQASSVNTMESDYRSGNFAGVVTQADRYLSRSSGQPADEARVLELKARALARQGKSSEADEVYAELQKKHPAYKAEQIRRERADLTERRKVKAKRRRQAPVDAQERREADFEDAEQKSLPSSIDNAY